MRGLLGEVVGYGLAGRKVLRGGDARQGAEVVYHVRLVVVAAGVGQLGEREAGGARLLQQRILEAEYPQKLLGRNAHVRQKAALELLAAQAGLGGQRADGHQPAVVVDDAQAVTHARQLVGVGWG